MADTIKKYLGQEAFGQLVTEIKNADAAVLQSAKDYCDSKDKLFETAGAGAQALADAKTYADEKIADAVAPLATTEALNAVDGKVTAEVTRATTEEARIVGLVEAVDDKADANAEAIATINDATNGILAQAKADSKAKADAVQESVDELAELVGELPEGTTAATVVEYINKKTEGIATDAALGELNSQVSGLQTAVQGIQSDYLKAADKTELSEDITEVQEAVDTLSSTHATDKAALEGAIALKADQTALNEVSAVANAAVKQADYDVKVKALEDEDARIAGLISAEVERAAGVEAGLAERLVEVETFFKTAEGETIDQAMDTLVEIQKYITDDGAAADEMIKDIAANKKAIEDHVATNHDFAGADAALKAELEGKINGKVAQGDFDAVEGRVDTLEGEMDAVEGKVSTLEGHMTTVQGAVATKVEQEAYNTKVQALEEADADQVERIEALEAKFGDGEGNVESQIEAAKNAAIEAAAADATTKANTAEANAKAEAARLDGLMNARVEALEAIDHEHANKALLDTYTQTEANLADAVAKKHAHANADALNGITADKVSAWDASEQNAKTYADGLNTAMTTKVDDLTGVVNTKAAASDLEDAVDRIDANEDAIALNKAAHEANAAAIAAFQPYTASEVTAMFLNN